MELRAGNLLLALDEGTGAIVRIEDRGTGLVHVAENPDSFLFRITVPHGTWSTRYVDNSMKPPTIVRCGEGLVVLTWPDAPAADGTPSGLEVEVTLDAASSSDEVRFVTRVANNGADTVTDVCLPAVCGWTGLGGEGKDRLVLGGHLGRNPHRFPVNIGTTYGQFCQTARAEYPTDLYAPWADLSGPGGGLSYIYYMTRPQNGTLWERNMAGIAPGLRLAFGWRVPCVIRPGESWESFPVGISAHDGDWHTTADRFGAWMDTWFVPPPSRPAMREIIGFQNLFLRGFDGTLFHDLKAIPGLAAEGRRYGVEHLCVWDEVSLGIYERQDDRDLLAYSSDERECLRAALRQAREDGTNCNALVNTRLVPNNPAFIARYGDEASQLLDGSLRMENYSGSHNFMGGWTHDRGPTCFIASPFAETYRERVRRWTCDYMDLGYVSMFFDQPFELTPDYGRVEQGCRPEDTYGAVFSLVGDIRAMLHRNSADAYLIGEYCEAFMAQHIDLWMSWYTDMQEALYAAYSIPRTMHSWVVDADPAQASRAFALGMYLCLCTHGNEATLAAVPEFGDHVLKLATLRKRTADRTVHARFRDNQGIDVKADGAAEAYAFDGPLGPTVIVASPGGGGKAAIEVDRGRFLAPGNLSGRLHRLGGGEKDVRGDRLEIEVKPNDVAVWTL